MSDIIEEILENAVKSRIFRNREILRPDYIPDTLPHREDEIKRLAQILAPILRIERPNNIFIYGLTGTGKTAVTLYVLQHIDKKAKEIGVPFKYSYINCRQNDTPYRVLSELALSLGVRVPFTGLATSEVYKRIVRALEVRKRIILIVLDEIDFIIKKHGDDLLYKLVRINDILKNSKASIIGITNDINFVEKLDPRVRSSLGEEELIFSPYNAIQLEDILRQRAEEAFYDNILDHGVIELCAAIAAREHGDARRALDLLRIAGELAEREGAEKVTLEHVYEARDELEKDRVREVLQTLPLHSKLVLLAILMNTEIGKTTTTGEVYNTYVNICGKIRMETVTQRRVSDIINELDMLGIINAKVVSRGRYGKTKIITINIRSNTLYEALSRDPRLEPIINSIRSR